MLTTDPESTSAKFLLFGSVVDRTSKRPYVMIQFDFSDLYRKCDENDFEEWYARNNVDGNGPDCLMGRKVMLLAFSRDLIAMIFTKSIHRLDALQAT